MTSTLVNAAAGLAAVAQRLTPARPGGRALLDQLREHDEDAAKTVRKGLKAAARDLTRSPVRIVFGGHFSSGKSTMINMLIGQPLLPVGDYPETGVPCVIATGAENSIRVTAGREVHTMPFSTASIAASVTLIGDDGRQRAEAVRNTRLDVTVAGGPIAHNAVWIDSPGINDSPEMTERATAVADEADTLIWLVNTRLPLTEAEVALLRRHVELRGPASVVFLVNAFLDEDSPATWEWFLAERADYHRHRIDSFLDTGSVAKQIVFASARAAAASPDGFGGPEARALLAELSVPGLHSRVAATRAFAVRGALTRLSEELERREDAEATRMGERRVAAEQAQVAGRRGYDAFMAGAGSGVRQILADRREEAADLVSAIAARVDVTPRAADYWPEQLREGLAGLAAKVGTETAAVVSDQASSHDQATPPASLAGDVTAAIEPGTVAVDSVVVPGVGGSVAAGSAMGLAAGTVVPVLGHIVGTAAGAIIGGWRAKSARAEAVGRLRTAVRAAGNATATTMFAEEPVLAVVRKAYPGTTELPEPDDGRLVTLRAARAHLASIGADLDALRTSFHSAAADLDSLRSGDDQ